MLFSVLLAGGLSSRMGQDKSSLKLGEETLLQHSINLLERCGSDRILISGNIENHDCIPDLHPKCGPLGGIYSSLSFIKQEYALDNSPILIIPVDMPMLTEDALKGVIVGISEQKNNENNEDTHIQCCHYDNEVFPCVMRASEHLYSYLQNLFSQSTIQGSKRSMKGLMKYLNAKQISPNNLPDNIFFNVNNPQDWENYKNKTSKPT